VILSLVENLLQTSSAKVFVIYCAHCISCVKKPTSYTQVCHNIILLPMVSNTEMADIQPKNILLGVLDDSAFARFERDELKDPMPRKELPSHTVYVSRPMPLTKGAPLLCDFSEAQFDDPQNVDRVMPDVYRAPEVVLGMSWSYPIDVWGFAMTVGIISEE